MLLPESLGRLPAALGKLPGTFGKPPEPSGRLPERLGCLPEQQLLEVEWLGVRPLEVAGRCRGRSQPSFPFFSPGTAGLSPASPLDQL
jgi:hypothetical protein